MGLAAPKKRRKIGWDPNNTTWVRSNDGFGRKIMCAQGWTPGSFLGARHASHASHFSSANAAPIPIAFKEDNLGLGAKSSADPANSNFGLNALHDLYGRLNGKPEDTRKKEQSHISDLRLKIYVDNRWGGSNFVKGGFLVGDDMQNSASEEAVEGEQTQSSNSNYPSLDTQMLTGDQISATEKASVLRVKPSVDLLSKSYNDESELREHRPRTGYHSKHARERKSARSRTQNKEVANHNCTNPDSALMDPSDEIEGPFHYEEVPHEQDPKGMECKGRQKQDPKHGRKEIKQKKHKTTLQRKTGKKPPRASLLAQLEDSEVLEVGQEDEDIHRRDARVGYGSSNGAVAGLAVRQRFVRQKRMSSMDPQALREILMVKS